MRVAVLTISDSVAKGEREDRSGPDTCEELVAAVSSYLNAGWELTGGVHVATDTNGLYPRL